jgi:hypothetical protein
MLIHIAPRCCSKIAHNIDLNSVEIPKLPTVIKGGKHA